MQAVQTRRDLFVPSTTTLTFCRLGSQRRLVILWEWLTLWPYTGFFPHISHTFAMAESSLRITSVFYTFLRLKAIGETKRRRIIIAVREKGQRTIMVKACRLFEHSHGPRVLEGLFKNPQDHLQ
jgi:hypothetical protein